MTPDLAAKQAQALIAASQSSPVPQIRFDLWDRGKEWERAAGELAVAIEAGDKATIVLANSVTPRMRIVGTEREGEAWLPVVKVNPARDGGQYGFMLESDGRQIWRNALGATSPMVVKA